MEYVITFSSTNQAILAESVLLDLGLSVGVMPLPSTIKAGCGLCLRLQPGQFSQGHKALLDSGVVVEAVFERRVIQGKSQYQPYRGGVL